MTEQEIQLFGVNLSNVTLDELIQIILTACKEETNAIVANVNVYALNLAYEIPWFRSFLNNCQIIFCDGFGVAWAAQILYKVKLVRLTPPDWLPKLANECVKNQYSMFLLGARPGIAKRASEFLSENAPNLVIAGFHHGYFEKAQGSRENENVIEKINQEKPNILLVGFGMPLQEQWIMENIKRLDVGVTLPVGAAFDYLAGSVKRAPSWMTDHGLEWLGRLIIEPRRLWKRYIVGIPVFLWRVILQRFGLTNL